ncbi:MAG: MopE-related protein [Gammaproteobacteria bacterium]|nr:MopE-related protein [Gammaproteobacteria bacterium]
MGNKIVTQCDLLGYPLLSEYADDTCDAACHRNSQGQDAYSSGNWEYFCPEPIAQGPICTDADNDGFYQEGMDCGTPVDFDDNNPNAFPGATEDCTDGVDNNGDTLVDADDPKAVGCPVNCTDADNDGYFAEGEVCGTLSDFNDDNANAYPGAPEDCTDGVDNDGNRLVDAADPNADGCPIDCVDLDGDTYSATGGECGPMDCNDNDPLINPGAEEHCTDRLDNNCNGLIDTADMNAVACPLTCTDLDGDGYSIEGAACGAMDCDDANELVNPAALEICDDGVDNNCDNRTDASDSVCQTNSDVDDDDKPWWRKRNRKDRADNDHRWNRRSRDHDHDDHDEDEDDDEDDHRSALHDDDTNHRDRSRRVWRYSWRSRDRDD